MSSASRYGSSATRFPGTQALPSGISYPLQALGFWTAVFAPFLVLGVLAAGIAQQFPLLLTGLLLANVVGIILGRDYKR